MKREFLQNFKVGDAELPKEVIDAIMEENGRDIEREKGKFSDYDTIKAQLEEAQKTIQGFQSQDIDSIKRSAADWEKKYKDAIAAHEAEKVESTFQATLDGLIEKFGGVNAKAIKALLDLDALRSSKNFDADATKALEALKKSDANQFKTETPPPYSAGAGTQRMNNNVSGVEAAFAALNPGLKLD